MKPNDGRAVGSRVGCRPLSAAFCRARAHRLTPDVITSVVPEQCIGTYVLIRDGVICYVGRSDTDVQRRLLAHYAVARADYFRIQLHSTVAQAFVAESAAFHALKNQLTNLVHPAQPWNEPIACAFCSTEVRAILAARRHARSIYRNSAFIHNIAKGGAL